MRIQVKAWTDRPGNWGIAWVPRSPSYDILIGVLVRANDQLEVYIATAEEIRAMYGNRKTDHNEWMPWLDSNVDRFKDAWGKLDAAAGRAGDAAGARLHQESTESSLSEATMTQ